jgi:hypothetical protein
LARQKTRTRQKLFSAGSELRKGYTMPTIKKIRSVLMSRSKTFLVNLIITMMAKKSKTEKIKILIKIEKGKIVRKVKRRKKAKSTKKGQVRKTARKAYKKSKNGRRGKGFQGKPRGSKAEKRAIASAQRKRKR